MNNISIHPDIYYIYFTFHKQPYRQGYIQQDFIFSYLL